jgi:hypothetical protein
MQGLGSALGYGGLTGPHLISAASANHCLTKPYLGIARSLGHQTTFRLWLWEPMQDDSDNP